MANNDFNKYSNKRAYNGAALEEGQYLAPFFIENYEEVRQMDYHRDSLETWHFSGIPVLVGFTPVTAEQFPITMKLFWSKVRNYIASLSGDPKVISYDKLLDDMANDGSTGYDPGQVSSLENTTLLSIIIDDLLREVEQMNPRYGHILQLIKQQYTKGEIVDVILEEYGLKKTQAYSEIKAAQKLAKDLYYKD